MDRRTLQESVEASLRDARRALNEAARIAHESRNLRQRIAGQRYLRLLRQSVLVVPRSLRSSR